MARETRGVSSARQGRKSSYQTRERLIDARRDEQDALVVGGVEGLLRDGVEIEWPEVGRRFEDIRTEILRQPRDLAKLREEVLAMRQRMLDAHASNSAELFDIKQDPGGLVDVEFIVQYLILGYAHAHESLCGNLGNIALLRIAAELGPIPMDLAEQVRNIYREYRRMQHAFRLDGIRGARVVRDAYVKNIETVRALGTRVFG